MRRDEMGSRERGLRTHRMAAAFHKDSRRFLHEGMSALKRDLEMNSRESL